MKTVIVTGASRGLGLEAAKWFAKNDYTVLMLVRNPEAAQHSFDLVKKINLKTEFHIVDVSQETDILNFSNEIKNRKIDILVNNAGVLLDNLKPDWPSTSKMMLTSFTTNTLGPFLLIQKILPGMIKQNFGRIVNVSSQMAQLEGMGQGSPAYRISKAALNAVTTFYAAEIKGKDVLINSICPGWVRTDMGGPAATRSLDEGISGIIWAATLPAGGPTGGFFRDGKPLLW